MVEMPFNLVQAGSTHMSLLQKRKLRRRDSVAASASSGNWLDKHILRLRPRPMEQKLWEWNPAVPF